MLPNRDWSEMSWQDFAGAEPAGWIAVLPVAATEQHGPHLPVGVDTYIAGAYLARARALLPRELPVTFLPLLAVGASDEHRDFPGTLTLSPQTVFKLLTEIGESVKRAGLRKLVFANSHGGNTATIGLAARELRLRRGMLAVSCSFSRLGVPEGVFSDQELRHGIHAGDVETSINLAHDPKRSAQEVGPSRWPPSISSRNSPGFEPNVRPGSAAAIQDLHPPARSATVGGDRGEGDGDCIRGRGLCPAADRRSPFRYGAG